MTALILCCLFLLPAGSIVRDVAREMAAEQTARDLARLTAALPPARADLTGYPTALSPLDLPGIGDTEALAAVALSSRAGRHHIGVASGTAGQRARWESPTGQFWLIVESLGDLTEPCSHCAAPEDGEPAHVGCPGCSCPCSLVEAAS